MLVSATSATNRIRERPRTTDRACLRLIMARNSGTDELAVLIQAFDRTRTHFAASPQAADSYLANGTLAATTGIAPADLAALSAVCLSILNPDETLNREQCPMPMPGCVKFMTLSTFSA